MHKRGSCYLGCYANLLLFFIRCVVLVVYIASISTHARERVGMAAARGWHAAAAAYSIRLLQHAADAVAAAAPAPACDDNALL